jgi:hypothetical protein
MESTRRLIITHSPYAESDLTKEGEASKSRENSLSGKGE